MPRTYVALDLETTGLNSEKDTIIEVGAVKYRDGQPVEEFDTLVNPGRPIPYEITLITGIRNEDVLGKPSFERIAVALERFVGSAAVVGHNIDFDLGFLRAKGLFIENQGLDTWELASVLVPARPSYSLGSLAVHFGIPSPAQHRALNDAVVTGQLFEILCERAGLLPKGVLAEIVRLVHRSSWPLGEIFTEAARAAGLSRVAASAPPLEQVVPSCSLFDAWQCAEQMTPNDQPAPVDVEELAAMLQPGGVFADLFPTYEHRPQQVQMLQVVAEAFNIGHHLMVEAGTGTGKSVAYLLPAIAYAAQNNDRVVISTNTINLQDQLFRKDLPDLRRVLERAWAQSEPFRATLLKGRSNYLCTERFEALRSQASLTTDELRGLVRVLCWLTQTETGDQAELSLPWQSDRSVWAQMSAASEGCSLDRCERELHGCCYFYRARKAAEAAHVIVVNHALLMADAATQNRVLPEYHRLIVDEAHHLENAVTEQLSFRADKFSLGTWLGALFSPGSGAGAGTAAKHPDRTFVPESQRSDSSQALSKDDPIGVRTGLLGDISQALRPHLPPHIFEPIQNAIIQTQADVAAARSRLEFFWQVIEEFVQDAVPRGERDEYDTRLRINSAVRAQPVWVDVEIAWDNLGVAWQSLMDDLDAVKVALQDVVTAFPEARQLERLTGELVGIIALLAETASMLETWVMRPDGNQVCWVEVNHGERQRRVALRMAPVHVGNLVQENILYRNDTVIFTSATLRTAGSFDYVRDRLAAVDADVTFVGSPFDYKESTLLFLPTDLPEPNMPAFQSVVENALLALAKALEGRTLALFTSYAQLKRTASAIGPALTQAGITVLAQGAGGSRHQLLETFKTSNKTVLLGTRSFWEGVDVVGPALSALVLVRLPFAVPSDPIVAARSETFDDPFHHYQVPDAILRFRQGFGRLIRSKTDRGVVVVMDKRVTSKTYGRLFLESLPECTVQQAPLMNLPQAAKAWVDAAEVPSGLDRSVAPLPADGRVVQAESRP